MSNPTINGPEDITPGHFYHHAALRGTLYVAVCSYWESPATRQKEPIPGGEAMVALNGDLPGAIVLSPNDGGDVDFWRAFYPAPGLLAVDAMLDGTKDVLGKVLELERMIHARFSPEALQPLINSTVNATAKLGQTIRQLGHKDYTEARPADIAAKDHALERQGLHFKTLLDGLEWIADRAESAAKDSGTYDPGKEEFLRLAQAARNLAHRSPFHK